MAGGLIGGVVGTAKQAVAEPDFEDSFIINVIKEARKPRVVE
jgi:hypothetical protein